MTRSLPTLASVLLLAGPLSAGLLSAGLPMPAFAQEVVIYHPYDDGIYNNGDVDNDSIPNGEDPVDDRFDADGNLVRFEVGDALPPGSFGPATVVDANLYGLHPAPQGMAWNRLGDNFYLVGIDGRIIDAVYNLRD
jgi:hypothetical protein